jgi:hypothetical protein
LGNRIKAIRIAIPKKGHNERSEKEGENEGESIEVVSSATQETLN